MLRASLPSLLVLLPLAGPAANASAQAPASGAAQREPHWAYRPIARPEPPAVRDVDWCRDPLDRFVLARLEREGLRPAPPADRATWLRRVALDLTGLPPTPEEVLAFERDDSPAAFERQVDRLLATPGYGERMALAWLDLARYADSQGYEKDALRRHVWRWRDQVIDAFGRDQPFDQFVIEQLAGDLLPDATLEQRVATAFHRHTMTNTEGGTDDEEFRDAAVVDRVDTTATVFLGTTLGCAQCHDHKYDPFSQREYYEMFAFFDQTEDADQPDERPTLAAPTPAQRQQLAQIDAAIGQLEASIDAMGEARERWLAEQRERLARYDAAQVTAAPWRRLGPLPAASFDAAFATAFAPERGVRLDCDQEGQRWMEATDLADGVVHEWSGDNAAVYLHRVLRATAPTRATLALGSDDGIKVFAGGRQLLARKVARAAAPEQEHVEIDLPAGETELLLKIVNGGGPAGFWFAIRATPLSPAAEAALRAGDERGERGERGEHGERAEPDDAARAALREAFATSAPATGPVRRQLAALRQSREQVEPPQVPVMRELPPDRRRVTRVHLRGNFLTQGDVVAPDVPDCLPPLPADAPRDRLGLARWIVAGDNPLCARVQANRLWAMLFGRGLVFTAEDFGTQGEPPSHPELLDWLACSLRDDGWSLQRFLKRVVLSATYCQSSSAGPELRERDPDNVLLARGPSQRLCGEILRDQALAVGGLLSTKIGGPSVMPDQPDGVWGQIYSGERWTTSRGDDRWRRSLYTLWRRTSPHPAMATFDAPSREVACVRRIATNTPLQALVTWNEPQFVAAAKALAARVLRERPEPDDGARLERMVRLCLSRAPAGDERRRLLEFVHGERERFVAAPAAARALLGDAEDPQLAAWMLCAAVLFDLDEFARPR